LRTTLVVITKDEGEPLINLGKQNFNFYRYIWANSAWELITPDTEPVAFANGTYIIDIPSGIDPDSYLVQVEDSRGLIVVASSFSRYTCTLAWNPKNTEYKYAVIGSTSEITGTPDGNYATISQGDTCEVTDYQGGTGTINQVYFNIHYHGSVSGTLEWYYRFDGGDWNKIENLPEGGSVVSPLIRTYNATSLRATWTWNNLNTTDIQFRNNDDAGSENASVDAMYVTVVVQTADYYSTLQDATITAELLQNGTMRWLGQNLQLTTQAKPIPPIPVKSIHINQTINSMNREVPFQIEDWASNYRIPLGLTNNASVFNSRTMLVFLVTPNVSKVTIWWDGSDIANQTSYAWKNRYFDDDPDASSSYGVLNNGILRLRVYNFRIESNVVGGSATSTAEFMRINGKEPRYGAKPAYVIYNGIVRDIIQQEAEWSDGVTSCPNVYSQIVLTLPANATYYTYALRLIFVNSSQSRTITDLSAIQLSSERISELQSFTQNGTSGGFPIVTETYGDESNLFYNFSDLQTGWAHHWSEYVKESKGAGIMFTDNSNMKLYTFDGIPPSQKRGALDVTNDENWSGRRVTIEFNPVAQFQALFAYPLDVTWHGAVVTFDGTTPIYKEDGTTGLWIIVEYPPTIAVTTES
jgi:hypothetical protein